jgi:uncharacterized protein GlcG (DUF336 family)
MRPAARLLQALSVIAAFTVSPTGAAQEATFGVRQMTVETALKAAQAALTACRNAGFQVTVAVVDRAGIAQVIMRDRLAGAHTVDMAVDKAWTAASFRTSTSALAKATEPGSPQSGIRNRPRVAAVAGGLTMESAGALVGAIGVSGAPGGDRDEACALEGIAAVRDSLEL